MSLTASSVAEGLVFVLLAAAAAVVVVVVVECPWGLLMARLYAWNESVERGGEWLKLGMCPLPKVSVSAKMADTLIN